MSVKKNISLGTILLLVLSSFHVAAENIIQPPAHDPHYTKVGFFDLHICAWPKKPLLYLILFSTYDYDAIKSIEVFAPDNKLLGELNMNKYKVIKNNGKKEKHVMMKFLDVPKNASDGWYYAHITMKDGKKYLSRDLVSIVPMELPSQFSPPDKAEGIPVPKALTWKAIPGAKFYQIFLKDMWEEKQIIPYTLVAEPKYVPPKGLLKKGGLYAWRIQGRDVNENALLGDFNHGSLSDWVQFSVVED